MKKIPKIKAGKVRRLAPFLLALVFSVGAGAMFPFTQGIFSPTLMILLSGAALLICILLYSFNIFVYEARLQALSFRLALLIKTAVYTGVGSGACYLLTLSLRGSTLVGDRAITFQSIFSFSLVVSLVINSFVTISRIVGQNELLRLILGRYLKAREEERVVMFIDVVGSTTIAEKIGAVSFMRLLNDFIYDITQPILDSGGEIYKYVGDGVIITWNMKSGVKKANSLKLFFLMQEKLEAHRQLYLKRYQMMPQFRAGIHCGKVVIGEMGDFKREIAILGDTVNTAARIIAECSHQGKEILISEDFYQAISSNPIQEYFDFEHLGAIQLRGKENQIKLISVQGKEFDEEPQHWALKLPNLSGWRARRKNKKADKKDAA